MNNSYITIIKEKRTVLSRKRVPLNQNECTADFRIGVPFEQNLQFWEWCREMSQNNIVIISEHTAPEDFERIWSMPVKRTIDNTKRVETVEKLFQLKRLNEVT